MLAQAASAQASLRSGASGRGLRVSVNRVNGVIWQNVRLNARHAASRMRIVTSTFILSPNSRDPHLVPLVF